MSDIALLKNLEVGVRFTLPGQQKVYTKISHVSGITGLVTCTYNVKYNVHGILHYSVRHIYLRSDKKVIPLT